MDFIIQTAGCISCDSEIFRPTFGPNHRELLAIDRTICRGDCLQTLLARKHWLGSIKCACRVRSENENVRLARTDIVAVNVRRISELLHQLLLQRNHRVEIIQRVAAKLEDKLIIHRGAKWSTT